MEYFEDNREPDRFPDQLPSKPVNPMMQDLNITFVDPFSRPRKPLVLGRRGFVKRAVEVMVSARDRPAPALNFGRFTMNLQPGLKTVVATVEVDGRKIGIAGEGLPMEPKALMPDVMLSSLCEEGYEWNAVLRECRDVDECLQMGIRVGRQIDRQTDSHMVKPTDRQVDGQTRPADSLTGQVNSQTRQVDSQTKR